MTTALNPTGEGDCPLLLAVDSGGTKTDFLLLDGNSRRQLARAKGPGLNKLPRISSRTDDILRNGLQTLREQYPFERIDHSWLALAGPDWQADELLRRHSELGALKIIPDVTAVLGLIDRSSPGVIIHAGTGSFVVAWTDSQATYYGGASGWIIGDPGSGIDLGRRALLAQRSLPRSELRILDQHIEARMNRSATEIIAGLYRDPDPAALLASLAPAVLGGAADGDSLCLSIVRNSTELLLEQAESLATSIGIPAGSPIFAGGSILTSTVVRHILKRTSDHRSRFGELVFLANAPVEGVVTLMLNALHGHSEPPTLKRFNP